MSDPRATAKPAPDAVKSRRFVFVLLENFTLLSFASAIEALRIANRMAGKDLYEWRIIGEGGDAVFCSAAAPSNSMAIWTSCSAMTR